MRKWTNSIDWSALPATEPFGTTYCVSEKDIDTFIYFLFADISRKLGIDIEELKKQNSAFFELKTRIFEKKAGLGLKSSTLLGLQKLLVVPELSDIDFCIEIFEKLSEEEKKLFLRSIS